MKLIYKGDNTHNVVENMGLCFMQLLSDSSPQKKPNARGGSEHVELKYITIYSSTLWSFHGFSFPFSLFSDLRFNHLSIFSILFCKAFRIESLKL